MSLDQSSAVSLQPGAAARTASFALDAEATERDRWGWVELFVAVQLVWGAFLFVPGMQQFRVFVRAMPYLWSLAALVLYLRHGSRAPLLVSAQWLIAVFALLCVNLLHSHTHFFAGVGQVVFQLSIAAPMFWVARAVRTEARFLRVLWILFLASGVSAAVGVLQTYYPERFLPPEFSALGLSLNPDYVSALTYLGTDGRLIIRPPGLSDLPGGASISGLIAMVLGVILASFPPRVTGPRARIIRAACVGTALVGMTALYLTQVRSLTVMAVAGVLLFASIKLRQGRALQGGGIAVAGLGVVVASFMWATAVGGESVMDRFFGLVETGLLTSFQENRGHFLDYTLTDLLFQYPLGAGLGRWGMMQVLLGDSTMWQAPPIHVEIQLTGWLLDGGVLMWLCYGGALLSGARVSYLIAVQGATHQLQDFATATLVIQTVIIGLCFTGPVFNTQLGILFWTVTAALIGTAQGWQERNDAH